MRTSTALTAAALLSLTFTGCASGAAAETPTPTRSPTVDPGGAATPEAAAQTILRAIGTKDPDTICSVMAIQGKPVRTSGQADQCVQTWRGTLDRIGDRADELRNVQVSNVPVDGDLADLGRASYSPAGAKPYLLAYHQAQRIGGRWFVLLGG